MITVFYLKLLQLHRILLHRISTEKKMVFISKRRTSRWQNKHFGMYIFVSKDITWTLYLKK